LFLSRDIRKDQLWSNFPDVLWIHVLNFINDPVFYCICSRINRQWDKVCNDVTLWRTKCQEQGLHLLQNRMQIYEHPFHEQILNKCQWKWRFLQVCLTDKCLGGNLLNGRYGKVRYLNIAPTQTFVELEPNTFKIHNLIPIFWKNRRDGGGSVVLHMNRYKTAPEGFEMKLNELQINKQSTEAFGYGQIILLSTPLDMKAAHSHLKAQNQIFFKNLLHDASRIKCSL